MTAPRQLARASSESQQLPGYKKRTFTAYCMAAQRRQQRVQSKAHHYQLRPVETDVWTLCPFDTKVWGHAHGAVSCQMMTPRLRVLVFSPCASSWSFVCIALFGRNEYRTLCAHADRITHTMYIGNHSKMYIHMRATLEQADSATALLHVLMYTATTSQSSSRPVNLHTGTLVHEVVLFRPF